MNDLTAEQRITLVDDLATQLHSGQITMGELVKQVRVQLYRMTQAQYAQFINVSDKTLRDIEKGNTDPRVSILNKILAPGGLELSAKRIYRVV